MKAIENKKVGINVPNATGDGYTQLEYADLLARAVNEVPQGGINPAEMKKRLSILKALEVKTIEKDPNNMIVLEDADAAKLKELVRAAKWPNIHADIVAMTEEIDNIKSEEFAREAAIKSQAEKAEADLKIVDKVESNNAVDNQEESPADTVEQKAEEPSQEG